MCVFESDLIASVRLRIQIYKRFAARNQTLVSRGREMPRNDPLFTVRTTGGEVLEFHVDRCQNVGYLKQRIAKKRGKGSVDAEDQYVFCHNEKSDDKRLTDGRCWRNDAVIHLLVQKFPKVRDFWLEPILPNPKIKLPPVIWGLVKSTFEGLERGKHPIRSSEGSGGTYFMQDSLGHTYVSVFKPVDEEPNAVNNPQGQPLSLDGEGLKRGTRVGEGAFREVAAFILDHPKSGPRFGSSEIGFAGVPPTVMVKCLHEGFNHPQGYKGLEQNTKIGSLQVFKENDGSCEEMGPRDFPMEEVHKISVFDIRMANADRHGGNILVSREGKDGRIVLIPIDHGYCLPENFQDCTFDWLYWPQAQHPFAPNTIDYIKSLDADQDVVLLKLYGWEISIQCARTLHVSTMLLKKGAERGLSPFAIGSIMCRETVNKESGIEEIVRKALDSVVASASEAAFLEAVSFVMDSWLDKLAK